MKERRPAPSGEADGIIEGRNAVTEALRAGTPIDKIYLARGETWDTSPPPPAPRALWWWSATGASWTA